MKKRIVLFLGVVVAALRIFAAIPEGYYQQTNGLKKAELKAALHTLIGSARVLNYGKGEGSTWSGFYQTDRMDDGQVRDRYSYETFYFDSSATSSNSSAVSGMNIEHSFPKSWWGGSKNQAYCDLYNLMPCESQINSSKSNYAMGVVTKITVDNGCTKVGTGTTKTGTTAILWEPADEWKGDFARNYFYMVTAYSNLIWESNGLDMLQNDEWPTLQEWAYQLLLQWSREDPVDDIEKARNEAVYKIQGNRNPYIDYPNLAEYIWGDSIDYDFSPDESYTGVEIPDTDDVDTEENNVLLEESFANDLGEFTCVYADGTASSLWTNNSSFNCVLANAYSSGKTADDWLVSPEIDLTHRTHATLTFSHATGYNTEDDATDMMQVLVSTQYTGIPNETQWVMLSPEWPERPTKNWTSFLSSGDIDLSAFVGQTLHFAFRYTANESKCWAWEVKNVKLTAVAEDEETGVETIGGRTEADACRVYTLSGVYVGSTLPNCPGIYVVSNKGKNKKVIR